MFQNQKIGIVGTGLIGGSVALALSQYNSKISIGCYNRNIKTSEAVLNLRAANEIFHSVEELAKNSDIIIICTPLSSYEAIVEQIVPFLNEDKIVTDVGSVKTEPLKTIMHKFSILSNILIPAHPIAGKETAGLASAEAGLFKGKKTIITPFSGVDDSKIQLVSEMWKMLGAEVEKMQPEKHDKIYAEVSHFVQLLSFATKNYFGKNFKDKFSDFTRLMDSPKDIWADIFKYNAASISGVAEKFLENFKQYINSARLKVEKSNGSVSSEVFELKLAKILLQTYQKSIDNQNIKYGGSGYKGFVSNDFDEIDIDSLAQNEIDKLLNIHKTLENEFKSSNISRDV